MAILEDRGGSGCIHVQVEKFEGRHSWGVLGGPQGLDGAEGGPRLRVEQQPQKQFLFIDITRLLGQVPVPEKGGGAGWEGSRRCGESAVSEAQALLQPSG